MNDGKAYVYHSEDYLVHIKKVYDKSASTSNEGFICGPCNEQLNYAKTMDEEEKLIEILRSTKWTKINIDENCIVGWATRYYKENKSAKKSDFIGDLEGEVKIVGEIRKPNYFKDYIMGLVREADALSEDYVKNDLILKYINDPNCTVIMFENPPYAEAHGAEKQMNGSWKNSYLTQAMKKTQMPKCIMILENFQMTKPA